MSVEDLAKQLYTRTCRLAGFSGTALLNLIFLPDHAKLVVPLLMFSTGLFDVCIFYTESDQRLHKHVCRSDCRSYRGKLVLKP